MRIIRNVKDGYSYWGRRTIYKHRRYIQTHGRLFIHDIGDGGSKTDKFARDIGLLKEGWTSVPTTTGIYSALTRITANTTTPSRITNPGSAWAVGRRVWMCYYNIGHCYKLLNNIESAVYYWLGRKPFSDARRCTS
jgi:hypothetical protein